MKAYKATFTKKNGEVRTMTFAKVDDLPKGYLPESKGGKNNLAEGMELVWDLENAGYRVFNKETVIGKIEEFETKI
tara:strand:+ start:6315 stop:6542 length:228 start_codon:yes stop_codon:yes gene_type:complete